MFKRNYLYFFIFLVASGLKAQFNYGHQMDFGKNRIQYKDFVWTYLDYERYRVYSYQGGNELAKYVAVSINKQIQIIERRLDYQFDTKLNILVYNNQGDFKQSNLGLSSEEQTNIGGFTRIIGDKISVFFNGSHAELDQQIRAAVAELLINKIMYGGSAREMVRNSTLLNLPDWYMKGLVKYLSEGWTSYNDNLMYDDIKNDNFSSFNRLTGKQAAQAGHALWYHIVSSYGEAIIPNLLYMTRIQRGPDNAFLFTLGVSLPNLIYDFTEAYSRRLYMFRDSLRKSPIHDNSVLKRYKSFRHYAQAKVSPDGQSVIYSVNELNQVRVYKKDLETKKITRLIKYGPKVEQIEDYNYPLLAWHPNGKIVTMIYQSKDQLYLQMNDLESKDVVKRFLPGFEKINSFSYSSDGKKIAMSAVKKGKGQSDVFVFTVNSSGIEQLTNDIWDDHNPVFIKGAKQIVFESNRISDTIKANEDAQYFVKINRNMDLFMAQYPFTSKNLVRITSTPDVNEVQPQSYANQYVTYLSDKNGIYNRYLAEADSMIAFVDTTEHYRYFYNSRPVSNTDRNILEQSINEAGTHVAEVIYAKGKDMLLLSPLEKLNDLAMTEPMKTWHKASINPTNTDPSNHRDIKISEELTPQKKEKSPAEKGIDFDNYKFDGENAKTPQVVDSRAITSKKDSVVNAKKNPLKFPIQQNYYTSFYTDYVVTQFDNSFLGNNYQKFSGGSSPVYLNPGFNFLSKIAISDLMEDQRILGGFRINPNLDNEFMFSYEQRKRLLDHQIIFDRQTYARVPIVASDGTGYTTKVNTQTLKYSFKYPFSPVAAVRVSLLYRNDRTIALSGGDFSLQKKATYENLGGTRLEYIFDNTRKVMLNIMNGFRFKVWTEYWQFAGNGGRNLFTSGFDARHYLKIHRQITWCNRLAGGNSMGTDKLIFYLGGVDNWINPTFNQNINIVNPTQYGFQTLATNMRGFQQNIRNGNNFVVYNSELRIPVVRYILNQAVRSDFLNNFQVIGFTDLGLAWYGSKPLSKDNTENSVSFVDNDPLTGTGSTGIITSVIDQKSPLVGGVGFGFRSRLLGYFVRLDFGWGIDNLVRQKKSVIGLSFATDF